MNKQTWCIHVVKNFLKNLSSTVWFSFQLQGKQSEALDTFLICAGYSDLAKSYRNVSEPIHPLYSWLIHRAFNQAGLLQT